MINSPDIQNNIERPVRIEPENLTKIATYFRDEKILIDREIAGNADPAAAKWLDGHSWRDKLRRIWDVRVKGRFPEGAINPATSAVLTTVLHELNVGQTGRAKKLLGADAEELAKNIGRKLAVSNPGEITYSVIGLYNQFCNVNELLGFIDPTVASRLKTDVEKSYPQVVEKVAKNYRIVAALDAKKST